MYIHILTASVFVKSLTILFTFMVGILFATFYSLADVVQILNAYMFCCVKKKVKLRSKDSKR